MFFSKYDDATCHTAQVNQSNLVKWPCYTSKPSLGLSTHPHDLDLSQIHHKIKIFIPWAKCPWEVHFVFSTIKMVQTYYLSIVSSYLLSRFQHSIISNINSKFLKNMHLNTPHALSYTSFHDSIIYYYMQRR